MKLLLIALVSMGLLVGCADAEETTTDDGPSAITAVASLLATRDTTGELTTLEARLAVVQDGEFVIDAADTTLTIGSETVVLAPQSVRLGDGTQTIWYQASKLSHPGLTYTEGATARFDFTIAGAQGRYATTVILPASASVAEATRPAVGAAADIVVSGQFDGALLRVSRPDTMEDSYTSFPYKAESVETPDDLVSLEALRAISAGVVTIPAEAFSQRGTFEIDFFALTLEEGGDGVGSGSRTFVGVSDTRRVDVN